jgi:hypothetical protein
VALKNIEIHSWLSLKYISKGGKILKDHQFDGSKEKEWLKASSERGVDPGRITQRATLVNISYYSQERIASDRICKKLVAPNGVLSKC